ncbi:MAG: efflux RND transporter periplasmic adaptor subunit [Muribaculaceae bacterium]|nr:efflux RND transporter periplasmic adaptor subunit [Muribaculaceae bacterium]
MKREIFLKYPWAILLLTLIIGGSCGKKKEVITVAPPVKVTVIEVKDTSTSMGREYSGTVSSSMSTDVSFSVPGTVTALYAKEGQKVTKGQLLGKVRSGEYENAYNIAQAQLAEAQDGYLRLKKLHDANALPDVKWVDIQQKLKQAENMAEMAKRSLEDANLHSPMTGTVTKKYADVGQNVVPVEPIYEIISLDNLSIDFSIPENEIASFHTGQKASIDIESAGISALEGKVTEKTVSADPLTRGFTVKVSLPNTDGKILPGMTGNVRFEKEESEASSASGTMLPSQAVLLNNDNRLFVWVVNDSVAERRFVTADEMVANGILVKTGLQPGDRVIVEGMQKVGTGSKVTAVTK